MKRYYSKTNCLLFAFFTLFACKKDNQFELNQVFEPFHFGIVGELYPSIKNEATLSIKIIIPQESATSHLQAYIELTDELQAYLNGVLITNRETIIPYSKSISLSLRNQELGAEQNWTIYIQLESEAYGLGSWQLSANNLNVDRNFYADQYNTGENSINNCGPAVAAMACRWADYSFSESVMGIRNTIKTEGALWSTSNMINYLKSRSIDAEMVYLGQVETIIKKHIDEGHILILCLDMFYVQHNPDPIQKRGKFYTNRNQGKGHFILVKGYRVVDNVFYLEVYDPNSSGLTYQLNGEPLGKDRYYSANEIKQATENWWNYAIVVSPKN